MSYLKYPQKNLVEIKVLLPLVSHQSYKHKSGFVRSIGDLHRQKLELRVSAAP